MQWRKDVIFKSWRRIKGKILVTKAGEISYSMQTGQGKGNSLRDEGRRKGTFYAMRIGERAECMW